MFKLSLYTLLLFIFTACSSTTSTLILTESQKPKELTKTTIIQIPIPVREHGYQNFNTQIIGTKEQFHSFIEKVKKEKNWNQKENFISSLTLLPIDFDHYNLLLYRITENSGSTILAIEAPKGDEEHIVIEIGRDQPNFGTADMAYYALAYRVAKGVKDITFDNGLKKDTIKNISPIKEKRSNIPKGCLEWYDGCNDCKWIESDGDAICTERYCIHKGEFKCTKWRVDTKKEKIKE